MLLVIIFSLGYFVGGATALIILGLSVAARQGDRPPPRRASAERRG